MNFDTVYFSLFLMTDGKTFTILLIEFSTQHSRPGFRSTSGLLTKLYLDKNSRIISVEINTWNQSCWSSCHFGTMKHMILAWLCIRRRRYHPCNLRHQRSCWRMERLDWGKLPSFHHCIRRCICRNQPWCSSWQSKLSMCLERHARIWRWRRRLG